jgi:GLPGLI family protein
MATRNNILPLLIKSKAHTNCELYKFRYADICKRFIFPWSKITVFFFLFWMMFSFESAGQITSGKILFERKTNLYKRFKNEDWVTNWVKESDKTKVDEFEMFFNDSLTAFKPKESEEKENYSWMTSKNSVYQNLNRNSRYSIKDIWRNLIPISDSLFVRKWKITDSKRNISGYSCRKAIWEQNDSTRIYAWYCTEISVSAGPESFIGLPGMILGLATEDGGVIYFAKSVEQGQQDLNNLLPPKTKDKVLTSAELRSQLKKQYGKEEWSKEWLRNIFDNW